MADRIPVSKKTRFEVFKRDKFTCQYCGRKAPEVVLNADHLRPVADGGPSDILNLVTSCAECNGGKGARLLSDASVVERQRAQIEELEERRQQLEMMLEWRDELSKFSEDVVDIISNRFGDRTGIYPNESGRQDIRKWLKRMSLEELLNAADRAFDVYLVYVNDKPTNTSWNKAFSKIPAVASMTKQEIEKPYLVRLFYIQGILRKRTSSYMNCVDALESMVLDGVSTDELEVIAKRVDDWEEFCAKVNAVLIEKRDGEK